MTVQQLKEAICETTVVLEGLSGVAASLGYDKVGKALEGCSTTVAGAYIGILRQDGFFEQFKGDN